MSHLSIVLFTREVKLIWITCWCLWPHAGVSVSEEAKKFTLTNILNIIPPALHRISLKKQPTFVPRMQQTAPKHNRIYHSAADFDVNTKH